MEILPNAIHFSRNASSVGVRFETAVYRGEFRLPREVKKYVIDVIPVDLFEHIKSYISLWDQRHLNYVLNYGNPQCLLQTDFQASIKSDTQRVRFDALAEIDLVSGMSWISANVTPALWCHFRLPEEYMPKINDSLLQKA